MWPLNAVGTCKEGGGRWADKPEPGVCTPTTTRTSNHGSPFGLGSGFRDPLARGGGVDADVLEPGQDHVV
jgi:hypothetical protein